MRQIEKVIPNRKELAKFRKESEEWRNSSDAKLKLLVAELSDGMRWNWAHVTSYRCAADACLHVMARVGLIEEREHPYGGRIWKVGNVLYGRTDGIDLKKFKEIAT